jgi:uncharacterized protein (TIGR00730 family)
VGRVQHRADVIADGVRGSGGRLVGISVAFLRSWARKDADELVVADDLAQRKALMLSHSDAVVVMAGGLGTLDEATDILEQKKHGLHGKPVVLLNTAGFYGGLAIQLRRMEDEGFLPVPLDDLVFITGDGAHAMAHLEETVQARRIARRQRAATRRSTSCKS